MDAGEVTPNSQIHVGKKHKGLFTIRYYFIVLFLFSSFHFTVKNVKNIFIYEIREKIKNTLKLQLFFIRN